MRRLCLRITGKASAHCPPFPCCSKRNASGGSGLQCSLEIGRRRGRRNRASVLFSRPHRKSELGETAGSDLERPGGDRLSWFTERSYKPHLPKVGMFPE